MNPTAPSAHTRTGAFSGTPEITPEVDDRSAAGALAARASSAAGTAATNALARAVAGRVSSGTLHLVTPDGTCSSHHGGEPGPEVTLEAHDPALARRLVAEGAAPGWAPGTSTDSGIPTICRAS